MALSDKRVLAVDCLSKIGDEVLLKGWVTVVRAHGKIAFLDLRDRSGVIQIGGFNPGVVRVMSQLKQQDVIAVRGTVKKREERYINPQLPTGTIEIEASEIHIVAEAAVLPFDMGGKALDLQLPTLLDHRSLSLRHPTVAAIFRVQAAVLEGFRRAAHALDCTEIVVPTIAASSTEGGAEVFGVDYSGQYVLRILLLLRT